MYRRLHLIPLDFENLNKAYFKSWKTDKRPLCLSCIYYKSLIARTFHPEIRDNYGNCTCDYDIHPDEQPEEGKVNMYTDEMENYFLHSYQQPHVSPFGDIYACMDYTSEDGHELEKKIQIKIDSKDIESIF